MCFQSKPAFCLVLGSFSARLSLNHVEASGGNLPPCSVGEHHRNHRDGDVAGRRPLAMGHHPISYLGDISFQPFDLRHQRHLRSGN